MKLFCALVVCTLGMSSAEESPRGKMIQLCGAELANALVRVCVDGDLNFFNQQHVQHHHQHNHQHDHQHGHQHEHQHGHHEREGMALKRQVGSLVDECCTKPCHVKDFVSYCPDIEEES